MGQEDEATLDCLGLKALKLMQEIVEQKLKLQECMKAGSINLAKSRYIMGNRNVSTSQLPTEDSVPFDALRKIEKSKSEQNGIEVSDFRLVVEEPSTKQKQDKTGDKKTGQDAANDSRLSCDPIRWFGVLVPQNLRAAQGSFQEAIELSVQIATSQAHLEALRLEFCTLKLKQIKLS